MVTLREVELADYGQLESIKARFSMKPSTVDEWRNVYAGSTLISQIDPKRPIGWVLETAEKTIGGHIGNLSVEYSFNGEVLIGASAVAATKDFNGVLGKWSFDANGDTSSRVMSGQTVQDGKFVFVKVLGN